MPLRTRAWRRRALFLTAKPLTVSPAGQRSCRKAHSPRQPEFFTDSQAVGDAVRLFGLNESEPWETTPL
jgi:hypothetical protein